MKKKEADEHTTILLTPSNECDSDNTVGSRDMYGHVYDDGAVSVGSRKKYKNKCQFLKKYGRWLNFGLLCLLVGGIVGYSLRPYFDSRFEQRSITNEPTILQTADPSRSVNLSVGMRNDYRLQACGERQPKLSFPDVDYALFGYDILKGFPLSIGHDPGFTFPIFLADYSTGGQSADCRYIIPKGLVIVPDVSCVTSFSSKIIKTENAYSKSLSVHAGVHASGWGASFSLSTGYSKAKSEFEKKERVFILSTAKCHYYFSKLVTSSAPDFNQDFLKWVRRLEQVNDTESYLKFFNTFGTHFPIETTFGARYTYEHSMTQTDLHVKESDGKNVAMSASYSGLFSIGASFGLNEDQKQEAKSFSKGVETRTITVGAAPPADGDAMKWASTVQSNPVPVHYSLSSIENLFTEDFMKDLDIDYDHIHRNLLKYKHEYQDYLIKK